MKIFDKLKKQNNKQNESEQIETTPILPDSNNFVDISNSLLEATCMELTEENSISIPIGQLGALGGAVASILPSLRTVTTTTNMKMDGLYRLTNRATGDALKQIKNSTNEFWGAMKTTGGKSKMAKLASVDSVSATTQAILPIDPATMMMAAALYSIEKQLGEIIEMEKQILSFLEQDKEAQIEGDLTTLTNIIQEYKFNWDKEQYISSHHKLMLDIKRKQEHNIKFYKKQIAEAMQEKQILTASKTVNSAEKTLEKKFKYYRLSLYVYSLASFLEVMLLGNFSEEYILQVKSVLEKYTEEYSKVYVEASEHIGKMANSSIEANVVKGLGVAEKAVGKFIGNIPLVKDGKVDEWLQKSGEHFTEKSHSMKKKASLRFEVTSDAGTGIYITKLNEMNRIYNYTSEIFMDRERVYLVEG